MSTPKESAKKEGAEGAPNRRRVSFAPVAIPSPQPPMKQSKRRWSLIRSLAKGKRLTSLTREEDSVLKTLSSSHSSRNINSTRSADTASSAESQHADEVCSNLRKSIAVHSGELMEVEMEFLQDLIDTPDIEPEHIEAVCNVLHNDPLYQQCKDKPEAEDCKKEENNDEAIRRLSTISQGPSYRRELLLHLRTESHEMSEETLAFTSTRNETEKEEVQEQAPPKEQPKRKSSKWGFLYNFQKALHLVDDAGEGETAELEESDFDDDADATFCILALSIDDFLDNPMVLLNPTDHG